MVACVVVGSVLVALVGGKTGRKHQWNSCASNRCAGALLLTSALSLPAGYRGALPGHPYRAPLDSAGCGLLW